MQLHLTRRLMGALSTTTPGIAFDSIALNSRLDSMPIPLSKDVPFLQPPSAQCSCICLAGSCARYHLSLHDALPISLPQAADLIPCQAMFGKMSLFFSHLAHNAVASDSPAHGRVVNYYARHSV